jgi:hypothetical protein
MEARHRENQEKKKKKKPMQIKGYAVYITRTIRSKRCAAVMDSRIAAKTPATTTKQLNRVKANPKLVAAPLGDDGTFILEFIHPSACLSVQLECSDLEFQFSAQKFALLLL